MSQINDAFDTTNYALCGWNVWLTFPSNYLLWHSNLVVQMGSVHFLKARQFLRKQNVSAECFTHGHYRQSHAFFATEKIAEKVTWIPKFFPFVDNAFHRFELSIGVECSFWKFAKCDNSYFHVDIKMNYVFPCLWKQIRYYLLNGLVANWKQLGTSSSKPWRF